MHGWTSVSVLVWQLTQAHMRSTPRPRADCVLMWCGSRISHSIDVYKWEAHLCLYLYDREENSQLNITVWLLIHYSTTTSSLFHFWKCNCSNYIFLPRLNTQNKQIDRITVVRQAAFECVLSVNCLVRKSMLLTLYREIFWLRGFCLSSSNINPPTW